MSEPICLLDTRKHKNTSYTLQEAEKRLWKVPECGFIRLPNCFKGKIIKIESIKSELLCKKQLNPIEEKELNTSHNSTFM